MEFDTGPGETVCGTQKGKRLETLPLCVAMLHFPLLTTYPSPRQRNMRRCRRMLPFGPAGGELGRLGPRRWRSRGLPGAYCTVPRLCPNPDHGPYNRARDRQRSGDLRPLLLHTFNKSCRDHDHLAVVRLIVRRHPANLADGDGDRRVARGTHLSLDRSHLRAKQSEAHRASGIGQR